MTSRERVLTAISKQNPDRVPIYCGRIDDLDYWLQHGSCQNEEELRTLWGLDLRKTSYGGVLKTRPGRTVWDTEDAWDKGYNSAKIAPLAGAETVKAVEAHNWPTLSDVDFELLKLRNEALDDQYGLIASFGFHPVFGTLNDLFGMEESMVLMCTEPQIIEAAVERIEAFLLGVIRKSLEHSAAKVDFFWLGDDFSTQRGMMISPELWRKFLKPTYKRLFELIRSFGLGVWFHSCGTFKPVIGELVDIGMDVWETTQAHLEGNEPEALKRLYGDRLTFFGAINCQQTLPFGTEADVRREVRERIKVLGRNGGYILGPDHSIQSNMPAGNVFAMFDEARKAML